MTLTLFKTYVKYDFKRTDKDTELVQAYNDMIIWTALLMPHSAYKYQSYLPLVAGQEDYSLPSTVIHLLHPVRLLDGSASSDSGYPLTHITKDRYDFLYPNPNRTSPTITGTPSHYTVFAGSILVGPLPRTGTNDLLEMDWTKRPTAQSGDSDTPALPSEWDEILKFGTLERLFDGIGSHDEAQYWAAKYKDGYGNPIGMCKRLLDIERDKEGSWVGQVRVNNL